jgi:putative transposase
LKKPGTKANWIAIKTEMLPNMPDWVKEVPYQIKAIAIKDACLAVKQCKRLFQQTQQFHEAKYRHRHDSKQTIFIPKSSMSEHGVYHTILGKLKSYERFSQPKGDCRLTVENGRWFINVPIAMNVRAESQGRIVAVDPGVRSFITFFSPESCGKLGVGDFSRIQRLCCHLDNLISRMSRVSHKQRYKMKKAVKRMRWKIKDLIDELHNKVALFLVENFEVIFIPKFETSDMSKKGHRKIRAKSVRSMLTFAHFRFQEFLKIKACEYGKKVVHINEAYTSKTCSWSGVIKEIGSAKYIKDGNIVVDRDYNGARGIFLRALRDSAFHSCTA